MKGVTLIRIRVRLRRQVYIALRQLAHAQGLSVSALFRIALIGATDLPSLPKNDRIASLPRLSPEQAKEQPISTLFLVSAADDKLLQQLMERHGLTKSDIIRAVVAHLLDGETLPKELSAPTEAENQKRERAPRPAKVTYKIQRWVRDAVHEVAKREGGRVVDFYRRAIKNFSGKLTDDGGELVVTTTCMPIAEKEALERAAGRYKASHYLRSALIEELGRMKRTKK